MDILQIIIGLVGLIYAIIIHEVAHGWMANWLGDPTAKLSGRLTLNPIPHIDPIGSILLPILSFLTPLGIIFGWAKPVPFIHITLRTRKRDSLLIALAGPLSNLLMAVIFAILFQIFPSTSSLKLIVINVSLAIFNLLPIHPLDGGKILVGLLPQRQSRQVEYFLDKFGYILLFIVIVSPIFTLILSPIISFIVNLLVPQFGTI